MGSPRTSAFAAARLPVGPALASGGFPGADVLRFYRADRFFRERKLPFSLGRFVRSHILICPVILVSSGLPGKAGILPGVTLLPFAMVSADFHGGKLTIFLVYEVVANSTRPLGERRSSLCPDRGCSFFKAFRNALSHQFTGRQGFVSAVAFSTPRQRALRKRLLPSPCGSGFFACTPLHRFTDRWSLTVGTCFQAFRFLMALSDQQTFLASQPRGILRSPHVT